MRTLFRYFRPRSIRHALGITAACASTPLLIAAASPAGRNDARAWLIDAFNLPQDQDIPPAIICALTALLALLTYWIYCMMRKAMELRNPRRRHWEEARRPQPADWNRARSAWVQTALPASTTMAVVPPAAATAVHAAAPVPHGAPAMLHDSVFAMPALPQHSLQANVLGRNHFQPDQELDLFGVGVNAGYSARGVILHRSEDALTVRMDDLDHNCPWCGGDTLQAYTWRQGDGGYLFSAGIKEIRCGGHHCIMVLTHPHTLEHKAAPIIIRAVHEVELKFRVHSAHGYASEVGSFAHLDGGRMLTGMTQDVSSAGMRLATASQLSAGDVIATLDFPALAGEEIHARVMGCSGRTALGHYVYTLVFTGLSTRQRELIARFVFRVQRANFARQRA